MENNIEIIRAGADELSEIYRLEQECFSMPWPLEVLYEDICVSGNLYYVLKENGCIVAYGGMWMILDEAHINNICVSKNHRRKGYARLLLEHMAKQAIAQGGDSMTLEVRISNSPAIALYESFGFEKAGVRKGYYSDTKEDALIMWKQGLKQEFHFEDAK